MMGGPPLCRPYGKGVAAMRTVPRTVPVAPRACPLPAPTVQRLNNAAARTVLWAAVAVVFVWTLLC